MLDDRPIHHDESLHGVYSLYYYTKPETGYYKYQPLLHGPLLYNVIPWFFHLFEISKFALRLPAVILGTALITLPLVFSQKLSKSAIFIMAIVITLSPTLTYWSRFMRHDSFVLFGILICLFALFKTKGNLKGILFGIGAALQFCAKENSFIHFTFIFVYLFYEAFIVRISKNNYTSTLKSLKNYIKNYPFGLFGGLFIFLLIFSFFYSAGFIYNEGILDGLYKKSLSYWFEQHQKERIKGPFAFNFLINSFYECWWVVGLILHLIIFYKNKSPFLKTVMISPFVFGMVTQILSKQQNYKHMISNILKLKIPLDYFLFYIFVIHAIIFTTNKILNNRKEKAISGFFFFSSLFTYSYLGEKVPWLAIYPCLSGLVFFGFEYDKVFNKKILPLFLTLLVHVLYTNYWSNFSESSTSHNLLTQVHTSRELESALDHIRSQMDSNIKEKKPFILIRNGHTWPTTWYLFRRKQYHYLKNQRPLESYHYILTDPNDKTINNKFKKNGVKKIIPLREWWVPDYKKMGLKSFFKYFLFKENWNESGAQKVALWTIKPIEQ